MAITTNSYKGVSLALLGTVLMILPESLNASIVHTQTFNPAEIDVNQIIAPDGTEYSRLQGDMLLLDGNPGSPEIPMKLIRFLVPDNAFDFSIDITDVSTPKRINLNHTLSPIQESIPINKYEDGMFTYADTAAYRDYSSTCSARILEESWFEGKYHIVTVGVSPFAYDGKTNVFEMHESMQLKLDYREVSSSQQRKAVNDNPGIADITSLVVNPPQDPTGLQRTIEDNPNGTAVPTRYYIISENVLLPALADLAAWKTQKGYKVVTKAIEDIYADSRYMVNPDAGIVDEAASLREYLKDEYDSYGSFFCLLVGDHRTRMPVRKVFADISYFKETAFNSDKYVPTDNYFSDLSDNWTPYLIDNGKYVGKHTIPYVPYIYVGRLLCHSPEEITNYTSKLILYETNPGRGNAQYLDKSLLTVQYDGAGKYKGTLKKMQETFNSVECLLDIKISDINQRGYPSSSMMLEKINENGYCSLIGHGEPSTIACSGQMGNGNEWEFVKALNSYKVFDNEDEEHQSNITNNVQNNGLDLMTNFDCPSVIYTLSCTTEPFDIYDSGSLVFDLPHTMASSYTVGGLYGGVAYLGNTRSGFFTSSSKLEQLFLDAVKTYPNIGIAESISKYSLSSYATEYAYIRQGHNLIGDPEMELWRQAPSDADISIRWNDDNISVTTVNESSNCRYVLNDGSGIVFSYRYNVPTSQIFRYPGDDHMVAVGVFLTGHLPVVKLKCDSQILNDCEKSFIVRDAEIGMCQSSASSKVEIGTDASVGIRAIDKVSCGAGLSLTDNGLLEIRCDKDVKMSGCAVSAGSKISAKGESVIIDNGFVVKEGGRLTINK